MYIQVSTCTNHIFLLFGKNQVSCVNEKLADPVPFNFKTNLLHKTTDFVYVYPTDCRTEEPKIKYKQIILMPYLFRHIFCIV